MAKLIRKTDQAVLFPNLKIADTLWSRTKGLLGTEFINDNEALWIHRCRSIHTCFMRYSIDCVFVSDDLKVVSIIENIKPFRMTFPRFQAESVFELKAGLAKKMNINLGDHFYVDTADC